MAQVGSERFALDLDGRGNVRAFLFEGRQIACPVPLSQWELDGKPADIHGLSEATDRQNALSFTVVAGERSSRIVLDSATGLSVRCENSSADTTLGMALSFSPDSSFHLPEKYNACRVVGGSMPDHEVYSTTLRYNFFIAETNGAWILFRSLQTGSKVPSITLARHRGSFTITFQWHAAEGAVISAHGSLDAAMTEYCSWLEKDNGMRRLKEDTRVPEWVHDVKLVIFLDMMRSNWEIAHDYADVARLASELKRIGCPKSTLFYLPGTNGAYDSMYPTHGPHAELGGAEGFRAMMDSLHQNGFRMMLHANAWGLDPCHPEVEKYMPYVMRDAEGNCHGWQTGGKIWGSVMPPSVPLRYRTGPVPVGGAGPAVAFKTQPLPNECEALVSFGASYKGKGRIRLTANHRSYLSPAGWLADHGEYAFPFPFLFEEGVNEMTAEILDDDKGTLASCWYEVRDAFTFILGCTYPILQADTTNPAWIRIFLDEMRTNVKTYGIDATHVDATHYHRDSVILESLREELPELVLSGEELDSMGDLKTFAFCQNAVTDLLDDLEKRRVMQHWGYLPDASEIQEKNRWLAAISPVWKFLKEYIYIYPHLAAPDGFVPVTNVCNIRPPMMKARDKSLVFEKLRGAKALGYIPGLRLNYRQYGLDADSRKAIQEIARG